MQCSLVVTCSRPPLTTMTAAASPAIWTGSCSTRGAACPSSANGSTLPEELRMSPVGPQQTTSSLTRMQIDYVGDSPIIGIHDALRDTAPSCFTTPQIVSPIQAKARWLYLVLLPCDQTSVHT